MGPLVESNLLIPSGQSQDPLALRHSLTAALPLSFDYFLVKIKNCQKLYFNGSWLSCIYATPDAHQTRPYSFASHSRECFAIFISVPFVKGYLYDTQMSRKITQKNMNNTKIKKDSVIFQFRVHI